MPLVRDDDLVQIDLTTPGEWVKVKRRLSVGEREKLKSHGLSAQMRYVSNRPELEMEMTAKLIEGMSFIGLEIGIKAWSFPEPLTANKLRLLDPRDFDHITKAVNDLWDDRTDEEKNASSESTPLLSIMADDTPTDSVG